MDYGRKRLTKILNNIKTFGMNRRHAVLSPEPQSNVILQYLP